MQDESSPAVHAGPVQSGVKFYSSQTNYVSPLDRKRLRTLENDPKNVPAVGVKRLLKNADRKTPSKRKRSASSKINKTKKPATSPSDRRSAVLLMSENTPEQSHSGKKARKFFSSRPHIEGSRPNATSVSWNGKFELKFVPAVAPNKGAQASSPATNQATVATPGQRARPDCIAKFHGKHSEVGPLQSNPVPLSESSSSKHCLDKVPVDQGSTTVAAENQVASPPIPPQIVPELVAGSFVEHGQTSAECATAEPVKVVEKVPLYPIFSRPKLYSSSKEVEFQPKSRLRMKRCLPSDPSQLVIDAGQKVFGGISCPECDMLYSAGDAEDEKLHWEYHRSFLASVKFPCWKNQRQVALFRDGRIIMVCPSDPKFMHNKMEEIGRVVDRELGVVQSGEASKGTQVHLVYVNQDKQVVGYLLAQPICEAYPVIPDKSGFCSESEPVPALCGVSRIWVASHYRRRKVATRLLDTLRDQFLRDCVVEKSQLAFLNPTLLGMQLAAAYTHSHRFLVL